MKRLLSSIRTMARSVLFYGGLKIAGWAKMSYIIGSHLAFFSAANVFFPAGGLLLGVSGSCIWFTLSSFVRILIGSPLYVHLIYGIPGFCAALYMASSHMLIRFIVPLVCMILFITHSVGFTAAPYAFYWLIPIALYIIKKRSLFTDALGATFVAHAVGSVFWLYLVPMPSAYWWGLIPVVAIERICFAAGAVLVYKGCMYCSRILSNRKMHVASCNVLFGNNR